MHIDATAILLFIMFSVIIYALMTAFVNSINRSVQLRKITEANKDIQVFIREVPQIYIDEETEKLETFTAYQPFYKRPVCGKKQEIEFVNESLMHEFPDETDYSNLEQVNEILTFWKKKFDDEKNKRFIDHPLRLFRTEEDKKLYWLQSRSES